MILTPDNSILLEVETNDIKPDGTFDIPQGVISIDFMAFSDCINLQKISIPDSVTSIGKAAFINCVSLQEISIPESVTSIGDCAFDDCINLQKIIINTTKDDEKTRIAQLLPTSIRDKVEIKKPTEQKTPVPSMEVNTYQENINNIFTHIKQQTASIYRSKTDYRKSSYRLDIIKLNDILLKKKLTVDIRFLEYALSEYQENLYKKTNPQEQQTALAAVNKLEEAVSTILDNTKSNEEKNNAILAFDKQARNSNLSEGEYSFIGCVVGGLAILLLGTGSSVAMTVLLVITGMAVGSMVSSRIFASGEAKAGNKNIVSVLNFFSEQAKSKQFSTHEPSALDELHTTAKPM